MKRGIGILEVITAVFILGTVAALIIPGLASRRVRASEDDAVAALREIALAETRFRAAATVDQDGDGSGEYGLLGELLGEMSSRLRPPPAAVLGGEAGFRLRNSGVALRGGYCFAVYLAGRDGAAVFESAPGEADPGLSETFFLACAWPRWYGKSGRRLFVTDASGRVRAAANDVDSYSGESDPPPPECWEPEGLKIWSGARHSGDSGRRFRFTEVVPAPGGPGAPR